MTETQPTRGYSATAKALHWLTVAALAAQFWVGYTMDADASSDNAVDAAKEAEKAAKDAAYPDEAGEEAAEEAAKAAVDAAKDHNYVVGTGDGIDALELHVGLGALILVLGIARVTHRGRPGSRRAPGRSPPAPSSCSCSRSSPSPSAGSPSSSPATTTSCPSTSARTSASSRPSPSTSATLCGTRSCAGTASSAACSPDAQQRKSGRVVVSSQPRSWSH